jgi:hypothetical protein
MKTHRTDEQNDAIRAQVDREIPGPVHGFASEDERDEHRAAQDARFLELVQAAPSADEVLECLADLIASRDEYDRATLAGRRDPIRAAFLTYKACLARARVLANVPEPVRIVTGLVGGGL